MFECVVVTKPLSFLPWRWHVVILSPAGDGELFYYAAFLYSLGLTRKKVLAANHSFADYLNDLGEAGFTLFRAVGVASDRLKAAGIIL
jgi:hypothetical protein